MRALILLLLLASWAGAGTPLAAATSPDPATITESGFRPQPVTERLPSERRTWLGPDGAALPFSRDAEILEFLRTAAIVSAEPIGKGITKPLKVLLDQDGIRAHAVFRYLRAHKPSYRPPGSKHARSFRDNCLFEQAAYRFGRLLGIRNIPPVVERRYDGRDGTLQIWVENAFDEQARLEQGLRSPNRESWRRQKNVRTIFDALIHNIDRNQGNVLIDPDWNVWLIDHTRSFVAETDLPARKRIRRCDRDLWHRLRTVDREAAAAALDPYLTRRELRSLMIRWQRLVEHVEGMIAEQGEAAVLF